MDTQKISERLASLNTNNRQAHPYPFHIAIKAGELIQGSLFYTIFSTRAASEYSKLDGSMEKMKDVFLQGSISDENYENSWLCLEKHSDIFRVGLLQSVLITMNSHWDWYIRSLCDFIRFSRVFIAEPALDNKLEKDFRRIGYSSISQQLGILQAVTTITFNLNVHDIKNIIMLSLIRNLGIHNGWQVDSRYIEKTGNTNLKVSDTLRVSVPEMQLYHESFYNILLETCSKVSMKYANVPNYKP